MDLLSIYQWLYEKTDGRFTWLLNLQHNPEVGVQIGRRRLRMRVRVADDQERVRLWPLVDQNNSNRYDGYQAKTSRQIPVVVLSPR